ncbi:CD2-associated protein isoform X2 [Battus philenor]|uniref:CD2-associated protein isoform X2 n=1 Tax=Battus philenor TaxID=42288 RepID=UPI0035D05C2F
MESNTNQKVTCIANYAYDASEPDELTIRPGDILRDVERLPGGWWRGELRGRRGMFPDNFVSIHTEHTTTRSVEVQGRCRAVFSYQPANPDELPLCVGDVLEVLGEVEEGWWQGRRQGRVGVFPSNFVVMLEPPQPAPPYEPAPALPPKPVKEQCRVLFPYMAVNEDELSLAEGDVVTIVSKDAPDRGWWRGELHGRVGLFPDNFVQLLPPITQDVDEKKPDRPPSKTSTPIYPILNKYSEKTASVKELTTSKISLHKENTISKESSTASTVTHTSKNETEKVTHNEAVNEGSPDGQVKKPPVPLKKSPTPTSGVGGLFSGLKNKMLSSSTDKEKSSTVSSGSSSGGEWDRTDGGVSSKASSNSTSANNVTTTTTTNANTFDHVERNSILNDPRAGRVKAPRRRPPSQALRDDTPQQIGLSNGHEVPSEKPPTEKLEEIRPRAREWEKHRAPWMEELKLNQAKKTSFGDTKSRSVSTSSDTGVASKAGSGSTDRILECGLEERKTSTHSMEMSKSTSSISNRISVLESFEETKVRHSLESKKDLNSSTREPELINHNNKTVPTLPSPTAAGRTLTAMLEELKKPSPTPPQTTARTSNEQTTDKSPNTKYEKTVTSTEKQSEMSSITKCSAIVEKAATMERSEKVKEKSERPAALLTEKVNLSTLERRLHSAVKPENKIEGTDALIAQLNSRITNLEKLIEVQNAKFSAAVEELTYKLSSETEKRQALQAELEKLAQCVTQV